MASRKRVSRKKTVTQPVRPRWPVLAIGAAGFVLLMFGIGYSLGWLRTDGTPDGASDAQSAMSQAASPAVASLADLLPRLEAKVAADPGNREQRLLLAQTYVELGQFDKGVEQLRSLHKQAPQDNPTTILLATALIQQGTQDGLREANKLLEAAVRAKPEVMPMVRLYQGDIQMKLGDAPGAVKIWRNYLGKMSADDPRRALFEEKIALASGPH